VLETIVQIANGISGLTKYILAILIMLILVIMHIKDINSIVLRGLSIITARRSRA